MLKPLNKLLLFSPDDDPPTAPPARLHSSAQFFFLVIYDSLYLNMCKFSSVFHVFLNDRYPYVVLLGDSWRQLLTVLPLTTTVLAISSTAH